MNLITYWGYIIIVFFMSFIPGIAVASRFKTLSAIENLAVSFGFSFVIIAALVSFFAFKLVFLAQFIFIVIIIVSLWYLLKKGSEFEFEIDSKFLLFVLIISLVSKFFLQTLWEYPVIGGDWFWHTFRIPYAFEQGDWTPPKERPALFNLLIYSYHNLLGTSLYQYWVSQVISVVSNSVYIFPAYLIAMKAFGDRVAKVSVVLMSVTPFLLWNSLYTWPKLLVVYFVLLMIYFLFFREDKNKKLNYSIAGFFGGLALLTHNLSIIYIVTAIILVLYREKINLYNFKKILSNEICYFVIFLILIFLPYLVWKLAYGNVMTSPQIYYPLATTYDLAVPGNDTQKIISTFINTPLSQIIWIRLSNLITTITPAAIPINLFIYKYSTYHPALYWSHTYSGGLSFLIYIFVLIWFLNYMQKKNNNLVLVTFVIFPLIFSLIMRGWIEWGLVTGELHATFPILIMFAADQLFRMKRILIIKLIFSLMLLDAFFEDILYALSIKEFYIIEGGLKGVEMMGAELIPGFQITNFISAFFLLRDDFIANTLVSSVLLGVILYFAKKEFNFFSEH